METRKVEVREEPLGVAELGFQWQGAYAERPPTVLIVDSSEINRKILKSMLRSEPYRILEAAQASEAFAILEREKVDLLILDLMMPGIGGPDFCRRIKTKRQTRLIPILVMTSVQGVENEIAGIESGADEFLIKPLHPALVRTRIAAMLRQKAAVDSLEEAEAILFALARAIEQRDENTSGHCERLATVSVILGMALGLTPNELLALYRGGFLHDIGKISVPDSILNKPGPLSDDEWRVMRTHTTLGEEICRPLKSLTLVLPIIRSHHERWDGTGYPDGLRGADIPLLARILQIADIYDALTSARPYKPAFTSTEALETLEQEKKCGWRDPELVGLLQHLYGNGQRGKVEEYLSAAHEAIQVSLENMRLALLK